MEEREVDRWLLAGAIAVRDDRLDRGDFLAALERWADDPTRLVGWLEGRHDASIPLPDLDEEGPLLSMLGSLGPLREDLARSAGPRLRSLLDRAPGPDQPSPTLAATGVEVPESDPFATRLPSAEEAAPRRPSPSGGDARFRILRPHARGGLGEVFLAEDVELGREVALKQIHERHADSADCRSRFLAEATITGRLEHPGVVPVYALGFDGEDRPYYAMRFIRGVTLQEAVARCHAACVPGSDRGRRALEIRGLLARFIAICNTIAYAHDRGILHRDLKPANIMLGDYGETLVVDWGLAKPVGPAPGVRGDESPPGEARRSATRSGSHETMAGAAVGTPQYMSPEQAAGEIGHLGAATDVYGLGAILFTILTGHAPFEGDAVARVLERVRLGDFPRPRRLDPALAPALEAICLKAMALDPATRYASARILAEEVERWLADEPVSAWPEPWGHRARRWMGRHRVGVSASVAAALVGLAATVYVVHAASLEEARRGTEAEGRVEALLTAQVRALPTIIEQLGPDRRRVRERLARLTRGDGPAEDPRRLPAALALLADDPGQADFLVDYLLRPQTRPEEVLVIGDALVRSRRTDGATDRLVAASRPKAGELNPPELHAAGALAPMLPGDPSWSRLAGPLARSLVRENPLDLGTWSQVFRPVAGHLTGPLRAIYSDRDAPDPGRSGNALALLIEFAVRPDNLDQVADLVALLGDSDPETFARLLDRLSSPSSRDRAVGVLTSRLAGSHRPDPGSAPRRGRWAMALLRLGQAEAVWPLFRHRDDPGPRSELIHNLARFGFDPSTIIERLRVEPDASARRALILALGEFSDSSLPAADRRTLGGTLLEWYRTDPDPGLHGATGWLLRRWGLGAELESIDRGLASPKLPRDRDWFVNGQGQTLAIVRGPTEFLMGSPDDAAIRQPDEVPRRVRIDRTFAIAVRELTLADYARFLDANPAPGRFRPDRVEKLRDFFATPDAPIVAVDWYDCARYCNWLSKEEGLPPSEWCYPEEIKPGSPVDMPSDYLSRAGYRMPTEAEWEYACRAGSNTPWPFGASAEWLPRYAWFSQNAELRTHPVGRLMPNDLGLFDILGNTFEWLIDPYAPYEVGASGGPTLDVEKSGPITPDGIQLVRGGGFFVPASGVRSSARDWIFPTARDTLFGLRLVRTCP